jgi:hypothetical protein
MSLNSSRAWTCVLGDPSYSDRLRFVFTTIREAAAGCNVRRDCRSADTAVKLGDPTMVGTMIVSMRDVEFPEPGMLSGGAQMQPLGGA